MEPKAPPRAMCFAAMFVPHRLRGLPRVGLASLVVSRVDINRQSVKGFGLAHSDTLF